MTDRLTPSEKVETDDIGYDGTPLWADAKPENRLGMDPAGSGNFKLMTRDEDTGLSAFNAMRQLATLYPLDPSDIAWPKGWPVDSAGRLLSVLEYEQVRRTYAAPNDRAA